VAPRFLGKTSLDGLELLRIDGHPVLDEYTRLRDLLASRAPAAAGLLAEPIGNWNSRDAPVVSWYAEAGNEPETLAAIAPDRRLQLEAQLRNVMASLAPLLADPTTGPTLRRALVLPTPDGIKAIDGRIVLTDWGLVRAATPVPADPLSLSPLAAYLAAVGGAPPRARTMPPASPSPPPPPPSPPSPVRTTVPRPVRSVWNWWLVPAGIVVATLFLMFGLWLGARLVAERVALQPSTVSLFDDAAVRAAIDRQKEQNAALERDLEERRRALSGNVCTADPSQMPRIGPDHAATVPPAAAPTPPGGQPFRGSLAELLTQSVVMVIALKQDGAETGSGFFITPEFIVTNRHVVESADAGKLFVTGGRFARATRAELVAQTDGSEIGSLDIALLRVPAVRDVQPLTMSTVAGALDQVVAAGFPGLTMHGDEAYGRLIEGDATAIPTVILTDGKISAVQTSPTGLKIMPHTAAVSGGNSGGPLVDACGRAVGVNTFITADREQVAHTNYAQKSDAVIEFLQAHGASPSVVNEACVPAPSAPAQLAPAQPAPAQASPTQAAPAPEPAPPPAPQR
jgi:S1-C subfamily serine protease